MLSTVLSYRMDFYQVLFTVSSLGVTKTDLIWVAYSFKFWKSIKHWHLRWMKRNSWFILAEYQYVYLCLSMVVVFSGNGHSASSKECSTEGPSNFSPRRSVRLPSEMLGEKFVIIRSHHTFPDAEYFLFDVFTLNVPTDNYISWYVC